jgi:glycosyltransferase involved in cell wall biosynthesis
MQRLIFVNRFFFPDHSATSQILSDLAFHLAEAGRDVHIVTSRQIYDDPKASLPRNELVNGAHVYRVSSTHFGRAVLAGRAIDYLSFYRSVWLALRKIAQRGDTIVAKTDPPLTSIVALAVAHRSGARMVNWLQDLYPEIAIELDVPFMRGPVATSLCTLRNRTLRDADATVVVGELMARRVETLGVPAPRIYVIPNWCNDEEIRPLANAQNPLRQAWGLDGKFVIGYSGNLGRAHEFETVLAAAERLRNDPRMLFLMIGGGKRFDELSTAIQARRLDNLFRFMPYQQQKLLPNSLAVADVHWLSLNPKLEGLVLPSKFYGIAAAGRPIIVIGDKGGELGRLVQHHSCGVVIAPGDATALVEVLRGLASAPEATLEMGARARQMLDAHFTRRQALARWLDLLAQLEKPANAETPVAV